MKSLYLVLILVLVGGLSAAQTSVAQQSASAADPGASRFAPGTELRVELEKTVDAKKAKPGDPVLAKTIDELKSGTQVVAPRGAKVIGHVVTATPHEKDSPSRLEIAFDKLDLGNGSQIPTKASIQALEKPASYAPMASDNMGGQQAGSPPMASGNSRMGGMSPGGMGQPSGAPNSGDTGNPGTMPAQNAPSSISPTAQGVIGMSGVSLIEGPTQDSVLTSEKHNVKLEGGTQMILRVQ
jgi:hypothetical protein